MGRDSVFPWILFAILVAGVVTAWSPGMWAISLLQVGLCSLAFAVAARVFFQPATFPGWPATTIYLPLVLVALWSPVQLLVHSTVYGFATSLSALYWLTNIVAFALAALLLQRSAIRNQFLAAMLYFGCGIVVISFLQFYTSHNKAFWIFESNYRVIGPFIYKNQFAAFVELLMPIALYRMLADRKNSVVFAFLTAMMFAAVLACASRTGAALLAVEVVAVLLAGWHKGLVSVRIAGILFAQFLVLLIVCATVVGWEELGQHFQDESSGSIRMNFLKSSLSMIRAHPWAGVGLGNWPTVYPAYARFDNGLFANAAHNDWAQWTAEGGIPFALLLFWVFGVSIRLAWLRPWGFGVVSVFLHSFLDYPTREPIVGLILFSLLGAMISVDIKSQERRVIPMKLAEKPVR